MLSSERPACQKGDDAWPGLSCKQHKHGEVWSVVPRSNRNRWHVMDRHMVDVRASLYFAAGSDQVVGAAPGGS